MEVQRWDWVFENMWRRGDEHRATLKIADTVLLHKGGLKMWLFTAQDGTVPPLC